MNRRPFRLIFKRGQSLGPQPTFSLLVSAEMSRDFMNAVHHYGLWNDIIYADPKLEETREVLARQSELKTQRNRKRLETYFKKAGTQKVMVGIAALGTYYLLKIVWVWPIKLIWWVYNAFRIQRTQIMRFHELLPGKTITTHTLTEIIEAEQAIQQSTETIEAYIHHAKSYTGEAFEARRQA